MSFILNPSSCYPLVRQALENYQAIQNYPNGTLSYLLDNNANAYFNIILPSEQILRSNYRQIQIKYNTSFCNTPNFDHCEKTNEIIGVQPVASFNYTLSPKTKGGDLDRIGTQPIGFSEYDMRNWCAQDGGVSGFLNGITSQLNQQIKGLYQYLDKQLLNKILANLGAVPGNISQIAPLSYGGSGQITGYNPSWNYDINKGLAEMGLNLQTAYIGGEFLSLAKKTAGGMVAPNQNGFMVQTTGSAFENAYYDTALDILYNDPNTTKILAVTPGTHKLILWSESLAGWANNPALAQNIFTSEASFKQFFANQTASSMFARIPFYDPTYQIVWDLVVKQATDECSGSDYMIYAELYYGLIHPPFQDVFCNLNGFTGTYLLDACPPPIPETCPARDVPVLDCICLDMPDVADCNVIKTGTVMQFSFTGGAPASPQTISTIYNGSDVIINNKHTLAIFLSSIWQGNGFGALQYDTTSEQFKICNYNIESNIVVSIPSCNIPDITIALGTCPGAVMRKNKKTTPTQIKESKKEAIMVVPDITGVNTK